MKKGILKKITITAALLLLSGASIVNAEYIGDAIYNYDTGRVEIEGKFFEERVGETVTILVLTDGADVDNLTADKVAKQKQLEIDENGAFSLEFAMAKPMMGTDKYIARVKVGTTLKETAFTCSANINSIVSSLTGASSLTDFSAYLDTSVKADLGLDNGVYAALSEEAQASVDSAIFAKRADISTAEELKAAFAEQAYIEALNNKNIDAVCDGTNFIDETALGLDTLDETLGVTAYKLYTEDITETGREKIIANLQGKGYEDIDDFLTDFVYQATLGAITNNKASSVSHISAVLKANNDVNKFDLTNYNSLSSENKQQVNIDLKNTKSWSKSSVQEILDTEFTSSSGGGGGSSFSSNPAIGGVSVNTGSSTVTTPDETETNTFTDLDEVEWASPSIEGLAAAGIVSGRGDGIFAPLDSVTRAEFLQMLVKALGVEVENPSCDFLDVELGAWYYNAVATGTSFGLASGYGNGYFGTTDLITRQDAAVMLNNAVTKSGKELVSINDGIDFADKLEIAEYAADDVEILVKADILRGADGNFMPKNNATRAEAAVMISKLMSALGLEG